MWRGCLHPAEVLNSFALAESRHDKSKSPGAAAHQRSSSQTISEPVFSRPLRRRLRHNIAMLADFGSITQGRLLECRGA